MDSHADSFRPAGGGCGVMEDSVRAAWEGLQQVYEETLDAGDSMLRLLHNQEPTVVRLSDGDWHVCEREHCPHACVDMENHTYFCSLCGLCWGTELLGGSDPSWTGRSTTTSDPDAFSGMPVGGWRPRKDAFAESQRAFKDAAVISDKEVTYVETQREKDSREAKSAVKRGAVCVRQDPDEAHTERKKRVCKRPLSRQMYEKLSIEANTVIDRLMSVRRDDQSCCSSAPASSDDVRLQNPEFVIKVATHQMVKRAALGEDVINQSRMHDVVVYSHAFAKRKRTEAEGRKGAAASKRRRGFAGDTKTHIVQLVLSLWKAASATEYLNNDSRRGADSFRPFVAGILYATKRGVCLANGMEIVPVVRFIADQLPTLRSNDATHIAKQIQSSSHRGLCCLHRSIASFETSDPNSESYDEIKQAFSNAAAVASQLRVYCSVLSK